MRKGHRRNDLSRIRSSHLLPTLPDPSHVVASTSSKEKRLYSSNSSDLRLCPLWAKNDSSNHPIPRALHPRESTGCYLLCRHRTPPRPSLLGITSGLVLPPVPGVPAPARGSHQNPMNFFRAIPGFPRFVRAFVTGDDLQEAVAVGHRLRRS